MALARLQLDDALDDDPLGSSHSLVIDTGTSSYYRLHLGKEVRREEGFVLLDGPYWSSPLRLNPRAGRHVDTRARYVLDAALVTEPGTLVQLETCRAPDGRGATWSTPVRVPGYTPRARPRREVLTMSLSTSLPATRSTAPAAAPRMVPVRSAADVFSRPASIADLIGQAVQAAAPVVLGMLNQPAGSPATQSDPTGALLTNLLRSVLGALAHPGTPTVAVTAPAAAAPAVAPAVAPAPVAAAQRPLRPRQSHRRSRRPLPGPARSRSRCGRSTGSTRRTPGR